MTDQKIKLPKTWKAVMLGDVTEPSAVKAEPSEFGDSKYIGLEHIESGTTRIIGNGDVESVQSTRENSNHDQKMIVPLSI